MNHFSRLQGAEPGSNEQTTVVGVVHLQMHNLP